MPGLRKIAAAPPLKVDWWPAFGPEPDKYPSNPFWRTTTGLTIEMTGACYIDKQV